MFISRFGKASDITMAGVLAMASTTFVYIPFCTTTEELGICVMVTHLGFYYMQAGIAIYLFDAGCSCSLVWRLNDFRLLYVT